MTATRQYFLAMTWPWRRGTTASGDEEIYYEVVGDDPALDWVVFTHGAGGSHAGWWQQVPAFADSYRVITWDCRGCGNSTFKSGVFGAERNAMDLVAVLDAAGADRAHLVGQSMGGWWVTETAVRFTERAQSLILTDSIGGLYTAELEAAFQSYVASARPPEGRVGMHPAIDQRVFDRDPALAFLFQELGTFYEGPGKEIAAALVRDRRTHAEVDETGVPVLMLAGSDDPVFPAPLLQKSAALLAHGEYVQIAGGDHAPFFTQAADWNTAVLGFLQRVARAG